MPNTKRPAAIRADNASAPRRHRRDTGAADHSVTVPARGASAEGMSMEPIPYLSGEGSPEPRDTLICLHCSASSGRQWKALADSLADDLTVLTPDLLGYDGRTPWPVGAPLSLDDEVEHLAPLITAQAGGIHLLGHSYGGAVALQIAMRWPDRIKSLTLVRAGALSPAARQPGDDAARLRRDPARPLGAADGRAGPCRRRGALRRLLVRRRCLGADQPGPPAGARAAHAEGRRRVHRRPRGRCAGRRLRAPADAGPAARRRSVAGAGADDPGATRAPAAERRTGHAGRARPHGAGAGAGADRARAAGDRAGGRPRCRRRSASAPASRSARRCPTCAPRPRTRRRGAAGRPSGRRVRRAGWRRGRAC